MWNGRTIIAAVLLLLPLSVSAGVLSGKWNGNDGGTYYLRHIGNTVYWYGESKPNKPVWSNVFKGTASNNVIKGNWADVPKGKTNNHGKLTLQVKENANVLEATTKTGGFGGSRWVRDGYKPIVVIPGISVGTLLPTVKEDCVSFNPKTAKVEKKSGRWKIVDGSHWVFDFDQNRKEARRSLKIIKRYGINQSCFVGRPGPSFQYLLRSGKSPKGKMQKEDCVSFNKNTIEVKKSGGRWKIVDGNHAMFDFGNKKKEANQAFAIIKKHGFTRSCFVGRPGPSLKYLRK